MNFDRMMKPALIGGVAAGVVSQIPILGNLLNCFCCALLIGGGVLASYLYIKDSSTPVSSGEGAMLGLMAGVFGAITSTLISVPISLMVGASAMAAARAALD